MAPPGRHVLSLEVLLTPYAPPGRLAGSPEPRRWLELFADALRAGLPRVDRRLAGDDPRRLRARVPPPRRPRRQLRRRPARRAAQPRPRADPLRDRRARASTSPARRRSPAPASGAPAAATAPPSCSTAHADACIRAFAHRSARGGRTHSMASAGPPTGGGAVAWSATMLAGSISLGRLAGAPLRIHWSAVLVGRRCSAPRLVRRLGVVARRRRGRRLLRLDPRPRGRPRRRRPPLRRRHDVDRAVGARRHGPPRARADARRGPRAGSPPPARWPAWPSASPAIGAAFAPARARRARSTSSRVLGLARRRQRRCSASSTCCPAPRSTAAASCGPCAGRSTATATGRCARPATPGGSSAGRSARSASWLMLDRPATALCSPSPACSSPSTPGPRSPTPTSASASTASRSAS